MESLLTRNKYPSKSISINVDNIHCNKEETYGTVSNHIIVLGDTTLEDSETIQLNFDWSRRQYADFYTVSAGRNFAS